MDFLSVIDLKERLSYFIPLYIRYEANQHFCHALNLEAVKKSKLTSIWVMFQPRTSFMFIKSMEHQRVFSSSVERIILYRRITILNAYLYLNVYLRGINQFSADRKRTRGEREKDTIGKMSITTATNTRFT